MKRKSTKTHSSVIPIGRLNSDLMAFVKGNDES